MVWFHDYLSWGRGIVQQKRCTRCGLLRDMHGFNRRAAASDGRDSWCRECRAAVRRQGRSGAVAG